MPDVSANPRIVSRRLVRLYVGLGMFGLSLAMMVRARLGLGPWDVLHQGLARQLGVGLGSVVIVVGVIVLVAWVPLRQRPGVGTVSNVVVVGIAVDAGLGIVSSPSTVMGRAALLVFGVVLNGMATALYIDAGFGAGPRDGLMLGLARRGLSLSKARTALELGVLAAGVVLGGTIGVGTVFYAVAIGPLAQAFMATLGARHSSHVSGILAGSVR